jgi:hypothetical protein
MENSIVKIKRTVTVYEATKSKGDRRGEDFKDL